MKAILNTAPGKLEFADLPLPEPGEGQVRVRTAFCGVCATDLEMIAGCPRSKFPQVLGHEWSGFVDKCGPGADPALSGRPCVAENVLPQGGEVGFEWPGSYGECLLTEASNLHPLPDGFPLDVAALIEPLAVAVRGLNRLRLESRDAALVLGDGPLGLILLMLLKHAGVRSLALAGGRPRRLELAKELGADGVANYHDGNSAIISLVGRFAPKGFPNVIDASGSKSTTDYFRLSSYGGKILLIGDYGNLHADFPLHEFLLHEFELIGSNASAKAWPEAVRLAAGGRLPLEKLISHRLPAQDFKKAIDAVKNDKAALKALLCWNPKHSGANP